MRIQNRLSHYIQLTRLHKPIGLLLLLWPTLWALWLAGCGHPDLKIVWIFVVGVILMRSAGCAINDFADRHVDGRVQRTRMRPLAMGVIKPYEAVVLAAVLAFAAFLLVLQCNFYTIALSFVGLLLASIYPFLKRVTHLPQFGLGLAFAWGIPMAFAAQLNAITGSAWLLFLACMVWIVVYDTMYAMADREDDLKIGVKSTAILFSKHDRLILALLQLMFLVLMCGVGVLFQLHGVYYLALMLVFGLFCYQQYLIKDRAAAQCFQAFLNNNWVGAVIFLGIVLSYL